MSKFGAHISIGRRDGFGEALKACYNASSPVPVLFALDQNVWPDVISNSPNTLVIFRTQPNGLDYPSNIYRGDPRIIAEDWFIRSRVVWGKNPAHYYAPINEPNPANLEQFDWLNEFDLRLMQLANNAGFHLALDGHSAGTPSDDGGTTRYQKWSHLLPALQYAKAHDHLLLLHEYGLFTTLDKSAPDLALRYRSVLDYLALSNADPQVVISECSDYNGYSNEGAKWLNGVEWYDRQVIGDQRVLGFCAYQLGGAENWYKLIPQWRDWVIAHPTPKVEPVGYYGVKLNERYEAELTEFVTERGGTVEELA